MAGLSRGGFVAALLAAHDTRIQSILGFAPLTQLPSSNHQSTLTLFPYVHLLIQKSLRFYIGNHDERVSTEQCFTFIKTLADHAYEQRIRPPAVELIIYPSIGHKGHGTPLTIFEQGAQWIQSQLLN